MTADNIKTNVFNVKNALECFQEKREDVREWMRGRAKGKDWKTQEMKDTNIIDKQRKNKEKLDFPEGNSRAWKIAKHWNFR